MNKNEIREKLLKRRKIIGIILLIMLSPILLPLLLVNKLGEFAEVIADFVQNPFIKLQNKMVDNYKKKLEKSIDK